MPGSEFPAAQPLRAGYCTVPNPIHPQQVARISLRPQDVDVLILCSRNPLPLFPHLEELDERGYRYYFHVTLMDNPRLIDRKAPALETALVTFRRLSARVGPQRMIWRYDPLVFSEITPPEFHRRTFETIARSLDGHTRRVMVSIVDMYAKTRRRLLSLEQHGARLIPFHPQKDAWFGQARLNHARHDPASPSLLGWLEPTLQQEEGQMRLF